MANTTILQLPAAVSLDGSEWIECVQSGVSMRIQLSQIATVLPGYIFTPLATAPANPREGQAYFDTTLGYPRVWGADSQWHGIMLT